MTQYETAILLSSQAFQLDFGVDSMGQSRIIMQYALIALKELYPEHFASERLKDYLIINCCKIYINKKKPKERLSGWDRNSSQELALFNSNIKGTKFVLALDHNAHKAIEQSIYEGPLLTGKGCSWLYINEKFTSYEESKQGRNLDRISQWVETFELVNQD